MDTDITFIIVGALALTGVLIALFVLFKRKKDWRCPKCGKSNPNSTIKCSACGYALK